MDEKIEFQGDLDYEVSPIIHNMTPEWEIMPGDALNVFFDETGWPELIQTRRDVWSLGMDEVIRVHETRPGRPPIYTETMIVRSVHLRQDQVDWLGEQPGGMNAAIRELVDRAMI